MYSITDEGSEFRETLRVDLLAPTLPPGSCEQPVALVPRDSEWSGFCAEMAAILAEVAE